MPRKALLIAGLLCSAGVHAQDARPFAAPDTSAPAAPGTFGGIGQVTVALAVVLAAIFALGWILRRVRGGGRKGVAGIEVLSEIGLGTRERAVVIKVGSEKLLLGVAPGRVNLLHVLPSNDPAPGAGTTIEPVETAAARPNFLALLQKSLGR